MIKCPFKPNHLYSLDISSFSPHTKRRIWQESISALLLTSSECKIPDNQCMAYAQARDSEFPPYLLDFSGSPGERHVENLKVSAHLILFVILSLIVNYRFFGRWAPWHTTKLLHWYQALTALGSNIWKMRFKSISLAQIATGRTQTSLR